MTQAQARSETRGGPGPDPAPPRAAPAAAAGDEILLVAGEASGDLHGARLLTELRRLKPRLRAFGVGGDELRAAGLETLTHSGRLAAVGLWAALKVVPLARRVFRRVLEEVERRGCRAAVLVDFPEFNLRLAPKLKRRGVKVVYYISPQLWAWRSGRVRTVAESVDRMLVLLPFEADFYRGHGVDVLHVGHPLVDEVPVLEHVWDRPETAGPPYHVALLPGSRRSEIEALLGTLLQAAERLAAEMPTSFSLVRAPTVDPAVVRAAVARCGVEVRIVDRDRFACLASAHLALCASGTATLELGLLRTPTLVVYRLGFLSHLVGRLLVRTPYISLVNHVLGRRVLPELLQGDAAPGPVSRRAAELLRDRAAIDAMRAAQGELRQRLGAPGASRRAAEAVAREIGQEAAA